MLLERLKEATFPQHRELESLMNLPTSRDGYIERLKCFLGYVEPWEQRVFTRLRNYPALLEGRAKTEWLKNDLAQLGLAASEISALPRCADLPELADVSVAVGSLYVLEGSTLGGQIISRHLREKLAIYPDTGGQYFNSYGSNTGKMWRGILDALLSFSSPDSDDRIVEGARETFRTLQQWFLATECHVARQ